MQQCCKCNKLNATLLHLGICFFEKRERKTSFISFDYIILTHFWNWHYSKSKSKIMQIETIQTKRLILKKVDEPVLKFIYENYSIEEQIKFLGLVSEEALQVARTKFYNGYSTYNKHFLYFYIIDKITKNVIGSCGYHTWYIDHFRAEIGYGLCNDDYKNKGFMSEALMVILDYGFSKMNLNRVEAFIDPNNIPSLKLVDKFGFVKEGLLREHYYHDGRMEDSVVFGLLKEEYIL